MPIFEEENLLRQLDGMSEEELDRLDFGVVRMDAEGTVTAYNSAESEVSGMSRDSVIGKNFFTQVAPCTNNFMVAERFRREDFLDETIDYVFTYILVPTPVTLRLLKGSTNGDGPSAAQYLLVRKREER